MGLDVFVEGHLFNFWRGMVGLEEGEIEVMLVDGYIKQEAESAHFTTIYL